MSTLGRPNRRPMNVRRRRRSFLSRQHQRPLSGAERLEPRAMLAGDLPNMQPSEYWNYVQPTDINNDGVVSTLDLLPLINSLTVDGARSLTSAPEPSSAAAEGEDAATSEKLYLDPNNDGMLNTLDLLMVVNDLSAEGEDPPILVNFSFVPVTHGTNNPITTIQEGGHYELRVLVQDTGVLNFMSDTRNANQTGVFSAFLDMFWDRAQTDVQVSETQFIEILGSPTSSGPTQTRFRLTFTDTDNTTQQTADILYTSDAVTMAGRIKSALQALSKIGTSTIGGLANVEVEPVNNKRFYIRFINDEANKNFADLSALFTTQGGATGFGFSDSVINQNQEVDGIPANLASFQEMFRPRVVRDPADPFTIINDDVNDLLYYTLNLNPNNRSIAQPIINGVRTAGGNNAPVLANQSGPRPLTQTVEVFRLRMTAKEKIGAAPVSFTGAYPQVGSGQFVTVLGDASPGGPFTNALPANTVSFQAGSLNITEPVSAIDDTAFVNEGTNGGTLNSVAIDVLGVPGQAGSDQDNTGPYNLELLAPPALPAGQGTVVLRTSGQDGIPRAHLLYTVPNADFNGVVTLNYTIRDGAGTPVSSRPTDVGTVTVTVRATNDPPLNSVPAGTQTVPEDLPAGLVFGGATAISISDVDAGAASVSIRLQSTNGTLKMASLPGTLAITGDGTNDLIIVGSIANINPALSGLKYAPNLHYNGPAQITVTTNDNGNSGVAPNNQPLSDVDVINITVTPTNDAPVNAVPGPVQVDESAQLAFTGGNIISVADNFDVPTTNPNMTVTLSTNSTQGGTLNVTASGGANVGGNNSQNVTVSGTIAAVNATLATLKFNAGLPEIVTLTVLSNDNGNTGAPGPLTDSDTVEITVVATVRPRANPNTYNLTEGPASFALNSPSVLANDLANAGAQVTLESVGSPSVGSAVIDTAGTATKTDDFIVYTPPSVNFFGQVTFTYSISETPVTVNTVLGANATATVTLNIANVADVPVAVDDGPYAASEDTTLTVNATNGVLANDTDADNLTAPFNAGLTAQLTQPPPASQGTINLAANGSFTWTPPAGQNFFGSTTFKYRAVDPQSNQSNEATVTINVASVNDAPVAQSDGPGGIYFTNEDDPPLVIPAPGVLSNDTDVETPNLMTAVVVPGSATNGVVTLNPDGSFSFDPNNNFNSNLGIASFQYRVNDNDPDDAKLSNIATVTIQVNPVNDPPVAGNPEFTVEEGAILIRNAAQGLRTAVTDVDEPGGFSGSIALVTGPAQGNLILNADGSFQYTPPATVVTAFDVTFTYTATDNSLATSNVGTVTIHVTPFNDPPVAVADGPYTATEDQTLTVSAANGVIPNDSDEETPDSGLTAILVSNITPAAAVLNFQFNSDGSFTYTPAANFFTLPGSPISFTYKVNDGGKDSNVVTVTINVNEVNDNPVANDDLADPVIKGFTNQLLPSALANDNAGVDAGAVPGDVLSILTLVGEVASQVTTGAGATVRRVGNNLFYDASPSFTGLDSFQYMISDGRGGTATATYRVNVVDFIPKDISGTVLVDGKPLAGVEVHLNGTNVLGIPVFAQVVTFTDELGQYSFDDLRPGNYVVSEITPRFLKDGAEPSSHPSPLVTGIANDQFTLNWDTPLSISTGAVTGLNFNELRIDATQLDDSAGLIQEILASSGPSGMVLAVGPGNTIYWSYCLPGWSTKATLQLEFGAGGTIPSILLTIGGVTKRIYQDPHNNTGTGNPSSPPSGSTARFRILGSTTSGEYIIRLDGTLSEFGFASTAGSPSAPPESGEGEGAPQMSDHDFRDAADQVFAEKAWA